jgi:GNAT superfamily N-acetyltransferase
MTMGESKTDQIAEVHYRSARLEDVPEMVELHRTSVGDLLARNNITFVPPPREVMKAGYEHLCATGIFQLAQLENRIVAIAAASVRDDLWYLSAFWALPQIQGKKIGMPLLRHLFDAGAKAGATKFFTWSSIDMTAMAAYMKLGMRPGYEIFIFEGTPQSPDQIPPGYEVLPLQKELAMEIDQAIRGTRRPPEHEIWIIRMPLARAVKHNGKPVGYYYINRGTIGPAGWIEPGAGQDVLALAARDALSSAPNIRLSVPGINHSAIQFALDHQLRLTSCAHFLTTSPFGRMEQYLPSGPLFF